MRSTKLAAADVRDRSERIGDDQAQLRRRYGQFLGEESTLFGEEAAKAPRAAEKPAEEEGHEGHDHAPGGHDHDHGEPNQRKGGIVNETQQILATYGHAHDEAENATMYDEGTKKVLRRALVAMWDAEKSLRAITPKSALAPEHKALEAIKELQQAERIYLHKTAFTPPPIKEEKRMTGEMDGAASYRRTQAEQAAALPEELRTLVQALSGEAALPALWMRTAQRLGAHAPGRGRAAPGSAARDPGRGRRLHRLPPGAARLVALRRGAGAGAVAGEDQCRYGVRAPLARVG